MEIPTWVYLVVVVALFSIWGWGSYPSLKRRFKEADAKGEAKRID